MAIGRLSSRASASQAIWPGFVDAMTALLLVLMFVLSIFMLVQFVLRSTITGQETQIQQQEAELRGLTAQLSQLSNVLAMETARADDLEDGLAVARASLVERGREVDALGALVAGLSNDKATLEEQLTDFEAEVASLLSDRDELRAEITALEETRAAEIGAATEAARRAATKREALEALVASLTADKAKAEDQVAALSARQAEDLTLIAALETERDALKASLEERTENAATRQARIDAALQRAATLEAALSDAERLRLAEAAAAAALRARLESADDALTAMTLDLEQKRREAEETLTLLAAAEAARDDLEEERAALRADKSAEAQARARDAALLTRAEAALTKREAEIAAQARALALANEQAAELRAQLGALSDQLEASEAKDAAARVEITALGQRLNAALAREAQLKQREVARLEAEKKTLEAYRSEFFGEMRKALGNRKDIRIVGDRFVFQSEVLFGTGSVDLGPEGRRELSRLADALKEVIATIPPGIDWLLVVEGHTDDVPVTSAGRYKDNWELSQGRALSVVRYLTGEENLPAPRLAALGYGEFQPLDPGNTAEARARNRRIELKFTERPGGAASSNASFSGERAE